MKIMRLQLLFRQLYFSLPGITFPETVNSLSGKRKISEYQNHPVATLGFQIQLVKKEKYLVFSEYKVYLN